MICYVEGGDVAAILRLLVIDLDGGGVFAGDESADDFECALQIRDPPEFGEVTTCESGSFDDLYLQRSVTVTRAIDLTGFCVHNSASNSVSSDRLAKSYVYTSDFARWYNLDWDGVGLIGGGGIEGASVVG